MDKKLKDYQREFLIESNKIENESEITKDQLKAVKWVDSNPIKSEEDILMLHKLCTSHLDVDWSGKYRNCRVYVGNYRPISPEIVPISMEEYMQNFDKMDSWNAHNEFEKIHPFQDFNGRVGRLIWLNKAVAEGYKYDIKFLHKYYYQTLNNFSENNKSEIQIKHELKETVLIGTGKQLDL